MPPLAEWTPARAKLDLLALSSLSLSFYIVLPARAIKHGVHLFFRSASRFFSYPNLFYSLPLRIFTYFLVSSKHSFCRRAQ